MMKATILSVQRSESNDGDGKEEALKTKRKMFFQWKCKNRQFYKKKIQVEAERKVHEERDARQCCFADKT